MTIHDDYEQWLHQIAALENHWQSCGNMTANEMIRYEQLTAWVRQYEQEQRNVPVQR
jgi:hypothetical protein